MIPKTQESSLDDARVMNVLHDIRNHLAAIKLAHKLLEEGLQESGLKDGTATELNAIIERNIARIEDGVRRMVNAKPGKEERLVKYDIARILEMALSKAKDRIYLSAVKIEGTYMPGYHISCNAEEISDVFLNIILNAIEAVEPHKGVLWITVYEVEKQIKIVFKDNGRGMEPHIAEKAFEPHFSSKANGLGLGLSYVRKVLDQHGAAINILSEPGNGTTVVIVFPREAL